MTTADSTVDPHYMAALAYEAQIVAAYLGYATFPKSRRAVAEEQVERMRAAARGDSHAYARVASSVRQHVLREAGASATLTRHQWETR